MKLTLKDRITILSILPKEGDFITMIAKSDLTEKIKITQEEIKKCKIENLPNGGIKWEKDEEKDYEITELETKMIKESLEKLDKEKKINDDTILIFKKFNV